MSLEYYLYCRKEYSDIIIYINEIINKYEMISDVTTSENNLEETQYELFKPEQNKIFFIDRLRHIKHLKKICDWKIQDLCKHDFVDDVIDISPDESKHITYCKICEYIKDK